LLPSAQREARSAVWPDGKEGRQVGVTYLDTEKGSSPAPVSRGSRVYRENIYGEGKTTNKVRRTRKKATAERDIKGETIRGQRGQKENKDELTLSTYAHQRKRTALRPVVAS